MAALVNPSSSAIICNDVPAKVYRVHKSMAASMRRCRVSVTPTVSDPNSGNRHLNPFHQLDDRIVAYLTIV